MRTVLLVVLAGCGPKIDAGAVPVVRAREPVAVIERPAESPTIWLEARILAGSAADPSGEEGLAALTARALVDAGAGERTSAEVRDALYPTGNSLEIQVDREWVTLRLKCPSDQGLLCVEVFADALVRPRFDEADVTRLRDAAIFGVTDGILRSEEALGRVAFESLLFEAHPYGHPIDGRAGALATLDAADVREFWTSRYVRESMTVGIAGGYDAAVLASLRDRLADASGGMPPELLLGRPLTQDGRRLVVLDTDGAVTGFHLGMPWTLTRGDPDFPALYLAFDALGSHRQSYGRLFRALRQARGLNYGDYAYAEPFVQRAGGPFAEQGILRRQGQWSVWLRPTSDENGAFALKLAIDEIERFARDGLTSQELDDTRAHLLGLTPLLAQDPGRRLAYALDAETTGTPDLLELLPATLPGLTLEGVNATIARRVRPEDLEILAVSGHAEALRDALLGSDPTPMTYTGLLPDAAQAARDAEIAAKALHLTDVVVTPAAGIFR